MRKLLRPILAFAILAACGPGLQAQAVDVWPGVPTGFGNTSLGAQMSFDSFNYSVRKRFESVRIGVPGNPFGGSGGRAYYDEGYGYNNPAPGYNAPTPDYNNPNPGYNSSYGSSGYGQGAYINPGYNATPSGYNPGYGPQDYNSQPGYNTPGYNSGYNPGYAPQGTMQPYGAPAVNTYNTNYGSNGYSMLGSFASEGALAMAPSSRAGSVVSARRRQLDCVYYSGFTAWADLYQTWASQRTTNPYEEGYDFRTTGPAIGFDYTNGAVTVGAAMTYNWGKLSGRDIDHDQDVNTWGMSLYGQYNSDYFYFNGTLGYGHNWFDSQRAVYNPNAGDWRNYGDEYTSNSVNIDAEFGWKMAWGGLNVIPTVGLRFFHNRLGNIDEGDQTFAARTESESYHVLEVPVGVNISYEIANGGMVFVPRGRLAWIPELERSGTSVGGTVRDQNGAWWWRSQDGAERSRHGFQAGLGLEAKFNNSFSAHVDYNLNLRYKQYEHHWNVGVGFTF